MIGFIDTSLQLQPIITAHNLWLPKTRPILYWTTSVFSSAVTDLVLIYELVTSSASDVRRLTSQLSEFSCNWIIELSWTESESYVTTDDQSASLS
jgi:hypothetical protein